MGGILQSLTFFILAIVCEVFGQFTLTLLHVNDIHCRFEETNHYGNICRQKDIDSGKCFGGIPRIKNKVKEIRNSHENVLFLSAGDQYDGTLWFSHYQGNASAYFTEKLGFDAMCFGNHEFINGVSGLLPFLKYVSSPFLAANLVSNDPILNGTFQPSVDLNYGNQTIGIVGYVTMETTGIVNQAGIRNLVFMDEITAVRKEVQDMTRRGINKIIVLGHGGYTLDQQLAKQIEDVDVVVGGHSHTFLYSGENPPDKPAGRYPTVVTRDSGSKALVVTAKSFGKYLGYLNITWDDDGNVVEYEGNPILLDGSVPQDVDTLAEVEKWKQPMIALQNQSVGETYVYLNGDSGSCGLQECTVGNLATDAVVYYMTQLISPKDDFWTNAGIAVWNSGGIKGSVGKGPVTMGDLLTIFPYRDTVEKVEMTGAVLQEMLEISVSEYLPNKPHVGFLQLSGIQVTFDTNREIGGRVEEVNVRCSACSQPKYEPLDAKAIYYVYTNSYILNGGDGYKDFFKKSLNRFNYKITFTDIIVWYIQRMSPIMVSLENRIKYHSQPDIACGASSVYLTSLGLGIVILAMISSYHCNQLISHDYVCASRGR